MLNLITVSISALALSIAIYGIFERRAAAYAAVRVRITELLAQIGELNVEEGRAEPEQHDDHVESVTEDEQIEIISGPGYLQTMSSLMSHRALLTYQVLALLERLHPLQRRAKKQYQLTATEHATLADSLSRLSDALEATRHWKAAIESSDQNSEFLRSSIHVGFASMLACTGQIEEARKHFQAAINLCPTVRPGVLGALNIYSRWIYMEMMTPGGKPENVAYQAYLLTQKDESTSSDEIAALRKITTKNVKINGRAVEECILDRIIDNASKADESRNPETPVATRTDD